MPSEPSADLTKLQNENAELKQHLARAVGLQEDLWKGVVEGTFKYSKI